jgi:hypothetical protein
MTLGQLLIDREPTVRRALARGAVLPKLLSPAQPVALYGAALAGDDALVLGRYQRENQALPARKPTAPTERALRRSSGGTTVHAGAGILYLALALHHRSSLMSCPNGRLLNRNVRGVLQGLRRIGAQTNYFGRDFLSFTAQPAVFVAWDAQQDGQVLLEFFISQTRSCFVTDSELAYPVRREPALRGQTPTTLHEIGVQASAAQLFDAVAKAHAEGFAVAWQSTDCAALAPHEHEVELERSTDTAQEHGLHWSTPLEEAIGFVSAGVQLDGAGKFAAVRVAGDFLAHRACAATLERVLLGVTPAPEPVARAVDAAFAHAGHDVEGVRDLRSFQNAILDAAYSAETDHQVLNDRAER